MHRPSTQTPHSATDLVNFLECEHLTTLDLVDLDTPLPRAEDEEEARLVQAKGHGHEARFLAELRRARQEMEDDELQEDGECLGGLTLDPDTPPVRKGKSITYTCSVPVQESKLKTGDRAVTCRTRKNVQDLVIDEERSVETFRIGAEAERVEPFRSRSTGADGIEKTRRCDLPL